jgi:hypothetical protein
LQVTLFLQIIFVYGKADWPTIVINVPELCPFIKYEIVKCMVSVQ